MIPTSSRAGGATSHARSRSKPAVSLAATGALFVALSWAQPVPAQIGSITDVDKAIIVDCFLRGQVRKLGTAMPAMQMPGTRVKVSLAECGARGGEAVLFDAADPRQAQKLWQESANRGDPVAQNRLGQIYEMGIGGTPDYTEAAKWYKRAADSGDRAAAINLATLYERGQGVPQDMAAATALYRKARGLADTAGAADDPVKLKAQILEAERRINALEKEIEQLRQSGGATAPKESELSAARQRLASLLGGAGAKPLPLDLVLEVGAQAGSRPSIAMLDPNVVLNRGNSEVLLRGDVKIKEIAGRAKAKSGLAEVRVNGKPVPSDRWGFFEARVPIERAGTNVTVVAIDRVGEREELSFVLRPGSQGQAPAPPRKIPFASAGFGDYHALVIGNNRYQYWPPLTNAEGDARAVANLLQKKYGFRNTKLLINATYEQILNAINDNAKVLGPNDNLLIYYAGHGQIDVGLDRGKRGYWIPVDGERERNTRWILNVQITDLLLKMQAHRVLVVSDSCYSGAMAAAENGAIPTIRSGLPDEQWAMATKAVLDVNARTMLTSGALSPVDDGGGDGHSLFARAFLDVLNANDGVLEGAQLFNALESRVLKMAQDRYNDQTPLYAGIQHAGHEGGDFFFVPAGARQ
jgi:hypothetical protein